MWDLIVSVPEHCLSFYYVYSTKRFILPHYHVQIFFYVYIMFLPYGMYSY